MTPQELDAILDMTTPANCPQCGRAPEWSYISPAPTLYCGNCYDCDWEGEETGYVSNNPHGWGKTEEEAIDAWNHAVAWWLERKMKVAS